MVKNTLKWAAVVFAVIFASIQFVRPAMTNPPIDETKTIQAKVNLPPDVEAILARSCNDCHSNKTNWVWYSNISPVSWRMADHVNDGRRNLSFSEFGTYTSKKAGRKLEEICDQVKSGEMPVWDYLIMHPTAKLNDADKQILCDWAGREQEKLQADSK
jgi:hypothetical protein